MGLMHDFSVRISALDRKLANSKLTDIKNELTFLKLEFQYNQSNYDSVLTLCKSLKDLNEENELKTLSWRILSSIKKGSSPITLISSLNSKTETAFNNFKKNKFNSSQTLSFAYYTLGYSAYNQKEYRNSIKHFQNAVKMDKYDQNFYNLATDLYYIGLCYEALLEFIPASDYFHRSYNIVNQLDNSDKKDETLFKALANEWLAYKDNKTIQEMNALKSSLNNPSLTAIIDNWLKNK
jgi:tetratricopeptide (TPR) repeat protein